MNFEVLTIFPGLFDAIMGESIIGRAQKNGFISVTAHNIRDYTTDRHRKTDDSPYGGSRGMVMKPEPIYRCHQAVTKNLTNFRTVYLSPQGQTLTQQMAEELLKYDSLVLLCGHYEGVDQRVLDLIVDEEISIGNYVLTGGELPAMVLIDTVARMVKGVLPEEDCYKNESHYDSLLEHPQYTRPPEFMGMTVPEVLQNGNHKLIEEFRRQKAIEATAAKRPELLKTAALAPEEKRLAAAIKRRTDRKRKMDRMNEKLEAYGKLQNGSDIRGIAVDGVEGEKVNLTPVIAKDLAAAFALFLAEKTGKNTKDLKIGIGRDSRISGPALASGVADGLVASGVTVFDCGIATTPSMFMTTVLDGFHYDGSVMITASHLPYNRNGLKFFDKNGGLEKEDIKKIITLAAEERPLSGGGKTKKADIISAYAGSLVKKIREKTGMEKPLEGLKIVVDAGNGAGGFFAGKVIEPLGGDTTGSVYLEPDGMFPNHIPNPENKQAMESIQAAVLNSGADLGVIFDTDVDRAAVVSADGKEINRNRLIALLSAIIVKEIKNPIIVTDSVTSDGLADFLTDLGVTHHRFKRGYKNVINECKRLNSEGKTSPLAIETSGHGAFSENYFLDDGAYIICKLLIEMSMLKNEGQTLAGLIENLREPKEEKELRIGYTISDFKPLGLKILSDLEAFVAENPLLTAAKENHEGIRANYHKSGQKGWFLLRLSLHDPLMVLNIESETDGTAAEIQTLVYDFLKSYEGLNLSSFQN